MKNNKPQHLRLSIMQAQEILQHESKFHAKYGRRLSTEASTSNASNADLNKQLENQASRYSHANTATTTNIPVPKKANEQQLGIPKPGYLKGVSLQSRDQREVLACGFKREENVEKQDESSHDHLVGPNPSAERSSHDDNPTNADLEGRSSVNPESRVIETRLKPKQEESLKRQKEKEQTDGYERERVKFLKELEDQERQKIVTEYLQHVYSQYGQSSPSPHAGSNKKAGEFNTRSFKVSKQGRVYSVVTRPPDKHSPDVPQVITKPAPILHQAARNPQGDKKIAFRAQPGVKGANGVRFFNEWNNSVFTDYINSSDNSTAMGRQKDKIQVK